MTLDGLLITHFRALKLIGSFDEFYCCRKTFRCIEQALKVKANANLTTDFINRELKYSVIN